MNRARRGGERVVLQEPLPGAEDAAGQLHSKTRPHKRRAHLVRDRGSTREATEGPQASQAPRLELWEDQVTRRVTTAWGVWWQSQVWTITAVDFAPGRFAPRRVIQLVLARRQQAGL